MIYKLGKTELRIRCMETHGGFIFFVSKIERPQLFLLYFFFSTEWLACQLATWVDRSMFYRLQICAFNLRSVYCAKSNFLAFKKIEKKTHLKRQNARESAKKRSANNAIWIILLPIFHRYGKLQFDISFFKLNCSGVLSQCR